MLALTKPLTRPLLNRRIMRIIIFASSRQQATNLKEEVLRPRKLDI